MSKLNKSTPVETRESTVKTMARAARLTPMLFIRMHCTLVEAVHPVVMQLRSSIVAVGEQLRTAKFRPLMVTEATAESGQFEGLTSVRAGLSKLSNGWIVPTEAATVAQSVVPTAAASSDDGCKRTKVALTHETAAVENEDASPVTVRST